MRITKQNEEFVRLYARDEGRLRRYVCALVPVMADVDDILQETAIALMRKFDQYDSTQPFFNWACRFALFEVLQHRKRAKTRGRHFSDEVVEAIAAEYQEHQQLSEQRRTALDACLRKLGDQDRRLVELRYFSEETVESLAQRIEEPVAKLYRSLARIRYLLATCVHKSLAAEGTR
ncbi:RNA polymerase sigma factor [Bremerella volcania]|uniref:RNA polymerase sigma factor n=1 Tax=Bremerella volcania TaxID=2527984 RepID=A0A518C346_9BACT|nr:sigma-70 family RNA polymerase sigma factor [Bremerella volcania]QDU73652.1 RNA polymerase sigma factor [Bremerella volcania]